MHYITASYMYSYYSLLPVLQPLTRITASYPYYSLLPYYGFVLWHVVLTVALSVGWGGCDGEEEQARGQEDG